LRSDPAGLSKYLATAMKAFSKRALAR